MMRSAVHFLSSNYDYLIYTIVFLIIIAAFGIFFVKFNKAKISRDAKDLHFLITLRSVFLAILFIFIIGFYAAYLAGSFAYITIRKEGERDAATLLIALKGQLEKVDAGTLAISGSPWIWPALKTTSQENLNNAYSVLDRYRDALNASVVYVLDTTGLTIAATNHTSEKSFVGENYSFRPYFKEARQGRAAHYFAQGITSGSNGYYSSCPVYDTLGKIIGVIVFKQELPLIDSLFVARNATFLVDENGIIMTASDPLTINNALFPISDSLRAVLIASRQFGASAFLPILDKIRFKNRTIFHNASNIVIQKKVPEYGWRIIILSPEDRIHRYRLIAGMISLGAILCMLIGFAFMTLLRTRSWISTMVKNQKVLAESEQRYRELAESLPEAVYETDINGKFIFVNKRGFEMFGYDREALGNITVTDLVIEKDRGRALQNVRTAVTGGRKTPTEYTGLRKDNSTFPVLIHSSLLMHNGIIHGTRGIAVDLTGQKKIEQEIARVEKLEALGLLAGGIAHDFNNLLTALLSGLSLIKLKEKISPDSQETVLALENAIDQGKGLTTQLLTYSRGGAPVKASASLHQLISETASFVFSGAQIVCTIQKEETEWAVDIDASQMSQVVQNILINAMQAMNRKGTIVITVRNISGEIPQNVPLSPGRYVSVDFVDNGPGISAETLVHVFDPFFTTKDSGVGLGLATAFSIVKKHDGYLTVHSEKGLGAVFTLYLPASEKKANQSIAAATPMPGEKKCRILVMDDEELILNFVERLLKHLGHDVVCVTSGKQAIDMYLSEKMEGRPFEIVLLDLTVSGGMGGKDTIQQLLEIDPDVTAIVTSGYSNDPVMAQYKKYGFKDVVRKPFDMEDLRRVIDRVV
jgi:PAS domain S-box-containing protein